VGYCHALGVGYDIQYPQFRYHSPKSYANNFMWKGFPEEEEEDI